MRLKSLPDCARCFGFSMKLIMTDIGFTAQLNTLLQTWKRALRAEACLVLRGKELPTKPWATGDLSS